MTTRQFKRRATLVVNRPEQRGNNPSAFVPESNLDLSAFRFTFKTVQQDVESPNNCAIRVYNLSADTVETIRKGEYSRVVLQAGYDQLYGVIFDGTIKQFRVGRESMTETYLDILAADGDIPYNQAIVNKTLAAGSAPQDRVNAAVDAMKERGATQGYQMEFTGGILPRGKVLFGMARAYLRSESQAQGATWNISNGRINIVPLKGYLPGEAVVLSTSTGMIGIPEQTIDGLRASCLLNPRIVVGGLVKIDNKSINQTIQANPSAAPIPYNQYAGLQLLAKITSDGIYRVLVAEHEGDNRGSPWFTHLVCLALDSSSNKVVAP
jgi:hypothetical protein